MQFFLGFTGYSRKVPPDPSMMVHFIKWFTDDGLREINATSTSRCRPLQTPLKAD
jgi:transposase, IS5 family